MIRIPSATVTWRFALLGLLAIGGISACIVLPIPQDHVVGRAVTVDPLTIKVGETTQEDVLRRLGNPDAIWVDERVFAYTWEHVTRAFAVILLGGPKLTGFGGDLPGSRELLLIQFERDGLVQRVERTQKPEDVPLGVFLKTWAKGGAMP